MYKETVVTLEPLVNWPVYIHNSQYPLLYRGQIIQRSSPAVPIPFGSLIEYVYCHIILYDEFVICIKVHRKKIVLFDVVIKCGCLKF